MNKQQKNYYNFNAEDYDRSHLFNRENRNQFKKISKIIEILDLPPSSWVLEIGAGTGIQAHWLLKNTGLNYTGVDISENMLRQALNRDSELSGRFVVSDGEKISFSSGIFDGVYFATSLHHLQEPLRGVKEAARLLKPGGKLVLMEPNFWFPKNFLQSYLLKHEKNGRLMRSLYFKKWAREAGLELKSLDYFLYTPPFPAILHSLYDKLDHIFAALPIFKRISIMITACYEKP